MLLGIAFIGFVSGPHVEDITPPKFNWFPFDGFLEVLFAIFGLLIAPFRVTAFATSGGSVVGCTGGRFVVAFKLG